MWKIALLIIGAVVIFVGGFIAGLLFKNITDEALEAEAEEARRLDNSAMDHH